MENGHGYLVFFKKNGDMSPHYELSEGELCIGSNTGNEIRLKNDNPLLLGVHAVVKINAEGIATITSKSQEAPVIVNNEPVPDSRILGNLDIFEILGKKFQYFNENVKQEAVKELEQKKEVPTQVKSKPVTDITRKSCMPALETASPKKNLPATVKTKTPIRKSVSKKSISENNPNGVQAIITPDKKPDKKGSSKTTSKIIVSKALGSPGNKRRTRLSLGEVPDTSETREMISSRNVLLSKSTINITISQTHEYSPLESPRVQNILSNGVYTTKSGRTPKKSTRLIEIEEPTKKSVDLINFATPDKDETAFSTRTSILKGTTPTPKTPVNKRLLLLKGTNHSTKKDTPPPGKGSPLIMVKAKRSQSKHSVKRLIKITSPKEKGNISVTFSPNFDTPSKQGSILKKTETPGTANKSRVSFAANQSISYFQNDSSIEDDAENNRSNDEMSDKEKVLLFEHNYSTPSKAKGKSIRNTSTPLSASSRGTSASSAIEESPRKSIIKRSLSSSEFDNQLNQPNINNRKSQPRQSRSFSANDDQRSTASYGNHTLTNATETESSTRQKSDRFSATFDASTQLAPNDSQLDITSSTSPIRQNTRKSTNLSHLDNASPIRGSSRKSINLSQLDITSSKSPTRGSPRKSVSLSQNTLKSDLQDEALDEDESLSNTLESSTNQVRRTTGRSRKSAVEIGIDSLEVRHDDSITEDTSISKGLEPAKAITRKSRQSSWGFDESLRLQSDPDSPRKSSARRSTLGKSKGDVSIVDVDFSQEEHFDSPVVVANADISRQSRRHDESSIKILDMDTQEIIKSTRGSKRSRSLSTSKLDDTQEIPKSSLRKSKNNSSLNASRRRRSFDTSVAELKDSREIIYDDGEYLVCVESSHGDEQDIEATLKDSTFNDVSKITNKSNRRSKSMIEDVNINLTTDESEPENHISRKSRVSARKSRSASDDTDLDSADDSVFKKSRELNNVSGRKSRTVSQESVTKSKNINVNSRKSNVLKSNGSQSDSGTDDSEIDVFVSKSPRKSNSTRKSNTSEKPIRSESQESVTESSDLGVSPKRSNVSRRSNVSGRQSRGASQESATEDEGVEVSVKESPIKSIDTRNISRRQISALELSSTENVSKSNPRQSKSISYNDSVSEAANVSKRRSVSAKKSIVAGRQSNLASQGFEMSQLEISANESVRKSNARSSNSVSKDDTILEESNKTNRRSKSSRESLVSGRQSQLASQGSEISQLELSETESVRKSNAKLSKSVSKNDSISKRRSTLPRKSLVSGRASQLPSQGSEISKLELSENESVRKSNVKLTKSVSKSDSDVDEVNISQRRSNSPRKSMVSGRQSQLSSQGAEISKLELSENESVRKSNVKLTKSVSKSDSDVDDINISQRRSISPRKSMVSGRQSQLSSQGAEISKLELSENESVRKSNAKLTKSVSKSDSDIDEVNISQRRSISPRKSMVSGRQSQLSSQGAEISKLELSENESVRKSNAKLSKSLSKNDSISEKANISKRRSISTRNSMASGEISKLDNSVTENVRKSNAKLSINLFTDDSSSKEGNILKSRSISPRKSMISGRQSQIPSKGSEISKLEISETETGAANISKRRSVSPRKSQPAHVTAESDLETSGLETTGVTDASKTRNASSRKSSSMVNQSQEEVSNFSAISTSKRSSKSTQGSNLTQEDYLSPIKAVRRSSARRNVLNDSSLTSAGEEQSSSSVLTVSSQSFSSFKKSEDLSQAERSSTASSRTSRTKTDTSNDSVFLNESVKSNRSNRSIKFSDNVSFTSTPFHKKMEGLPLSDESEIINVTSTSSVIATKEPTRRTMRSEAIYSISDSTDFESPTKLTSGRVSRLSNKTTTPLLKKKSVSLDPQTPEMNREVEDETPKSHVKPRRLSKSVYNPVTEDITPVTPEKLMISQQGESVFKTPINTPGLFESIKKSVIRKRARESQGSGLKAKRPRVEFGEDTSLSQDEEPAAETSTTSTRSSTPQPKVQKSPKNRLTNFEGVKRLMKSPQKSPKNDLRNIPDLRPIMTAKTPKNDLRNVPNLRRIMSPRNQNSPLNDLTKPVGIKNLMKTPRTQKPPLNDLSDLEGVAGIFNVSSLSGVESLHQGSDTENYMTDDLFTQISGKRAPRTYHSASPKKPQQKDDTRKTYHDIPESSPRVEQWVEEQVKITTEPLLPAKSKRKSSVKGNIKTPQKDVAATTQPSSPAKSKRKSSVKGNIETPQKEVGVTTEPSLPVKSKRKSSMKKEIETPEKEVTATVHLSKPDVTSQKRKSLKKELLSPVSALASPLPQTMETLVEDKVVEQTKGNRGKKTQQKTDTTKPKQSGRRKRILSEEDINTMVSIEQPLKKGRTRRGATIAEHPIIVEVDAKIEPHKGRKAVAQQAKVLDTDATEEDFKKPTAPKRGARNAKKEDIPLEETEEVATKSVRTRGGRLASRELESSEESEVSSTVKPVRGRRNKAVEIEQVEEPPKKRGKNKKQSESEAEIAPQETETEPIIKRPIRGRRAQKVSEEEIVKAETLEVQAPVSPKTKRSRKNEPVEANITPVVASPKKKRGGRNQPKTEADIASSEVDTPIADVIPNNRRGGRRQVKVEVAESGKEDTPVVEKKEGGRNAQIESLKDETPIVEQKKVVKGKKNQVNMVEDTPTENTAEPVKKVPARGGRGRQKKETAEEIESVEVPEITKNTVESPKKVPTRGKRQAKEKIASTVESPKKVSTIGKKNVDTESFEAPKKRATRGKKQVESVSQEPEENKELEFEIKRPTRAKKAEKITDLKEEEGVEKQKPMRNKKQAVQESNLDQQEVPETKPTRGRKQQASKTDSVENEPVAPKSTRGKKKVEVTDEVAEENKKPVRGRKKTVTEVETLQEEKKEEVQKPTRGGKKKLEDVEEKKTMLGKPKNKAIEEIKAEEVEVSLPRSPRSKKGQNSKYPPEVFETPEKKVRGKRVHFEEVAEEKSSNLDEGTRKSKRSRK